MEVSVILAYIWRIVSTIFALPGGDLLVHPCDNLQGNYQLWKSSATDVGVVVIGAGVSGLTAVKTLIEDGYTDVLLFEADHRIGGRVRTYRKGGILVEEGAEWIHGGERNPVYALANSWQAATTMVPLEDWGKQIRKNNGQPEDDEMFSVLDDLTSKTNRNGVLKSYYHTGYGQWYIDRFPEAYGEGWNNSLGQAWIHLLEKLVNGEEGTNNWLDISARDADQFVDYGDNHQWKNGYDTLIHYLKEPIPDDIIRLSSPVCKIFWDVMDDGKVLLVTDGGSTSYSAKHVIMTASVGHLKDRHQQLFEPPLPSAFVKHLDGVDLGVADKIQIGWAEPWWNGEGPFAYFFLWVEFDLPKEMEWMYGIAGAFSVHQQRSVLQMFVTGEDARYMENLPENTVKKHVLHLLSKVSGLQVPEPTFFTRSQWGIDPWKKGSYSSYITVAGVKNGLHKREQLAVPLKNSNGATVLLWAGEHTHNTRYGTVDGAMKSGEREAKNLLKILGRGK